MFVTTTPAALPGTCLLCPGSVRERFIDTEIQIEWYGAIILCESCITEMGRLFGMLSKDQADGLNNRISSQADTIYELQKQLAGLEGVRSGLALAGYVVSDHPVHEPVPSAPQPGADGGLPAGQGDVGARARAAVESLHDKRVDDLRSDDDSDVVELHL